jgi:hypothetical protein
MSSYALLAETNGKELETWYYFIKYQGNEETLKNLQEQMNKVDFYILDDLSTFDLEMDYLVCEKTAKEMTKIEINSVMFHRKFDGELKKIDFKFKKRDDNDDRLYKIFEVLGMGQIEEFIEDEDIDPEDLASESDGNGNGNDDGNESEDGSEEGSEDGSEEGSEEGSEDGSCSESEEESDDEIGSDDEEINKVIANIQKKL